MGTERLGSPVSGSGQQQMLGEEIKSRAAAEGCFPGVSNLSSQRAVLALGCNVDAERDGL